jgi:NhaA family Na+:H+ antiporter
MKRKSAPPPTVVALRFVWSPFQKFAQLESFAGILLLMCTAAALLWSNSAWHDGYHHFRHFPLGLTLGHARMDFNFELMVNDGLMAIFFLLVGLEIKREMLAGELATFRQSALPILGALGGMLVPAGIYAFLNAGGPAIHGWGVPMATDIAFAMGVLMVLGKRVPLSVKVFLVALAIIDDIGSILVIALFYTSEISGLAMGFAVAITFFLWMMNVIGVRHPAPFLIFGALLWLAVLHSGVHATLAGVVLAFCIPHRPRFEPSTFAEKAKQIMERFHQASNKKGTPILEDERVEAIHDMEEVCEGVEPLLQRLEVKLHPWISYGILPLFALTNAGVALSTDTLSALKEPIGLGIILGLILGKPIGIALFSWIGIRLRLGAMPKGSTWGQIIGAGVLGGIGFTMSIFIAGLAFKNEPHLLEGAKISILVASTLAGITGYFLLASQGNPKSKE